MTPDQKPLVADAANKTQVKNSEQKEKFRRERELSDIATVCTTPEGRRVLWRIMEKCRTFESIWENSARIHYNSGQQDLGHFVMSEILKANPEVFMQMQNENKKENLNV